MNLEDCTKEELIYLIKETSLLYRLEDFEYNILELRREKFYSKYKEYMDKATSQLYSYNEYIKPYNGKPILEIPDDIMKLSAKALKDYEQYYKISQKEYKKYNEYQKKMDKYFKII